MSQKYSHQLIAPYVRKAKFENPDIAIKVAEAAESYYKKIALNETPQYLPAACVGAAIMSLRLENSENISILSKMCSMPLPLFQKKVENICSELNIPCNMTFEDIINRSNLPKKFTNTCMRLYQEICTLHPNDTNLSKRSVYAAVVLIVATKRGLPKTETAEVLSKVTQASSSEIISISNLLRQDIGPEFQIKKVKPPEDERPDPDPKDVAKIHQVAENALESIAADKKKKKKQTTLSFSATPK